MAPAARDAEGMLERAEDGVVARHAFMLHSVVDRTELAAPRIGRPARAHCDSEDRPRSGAADRVVSGGWALIAAAISAGCARAERTALDAANEVEDQQDQQDDHEDPDQPEARTSDCKQHSFRPLVGMKYIQPTARAAKRPYPGARRSTRSSRQPARTSTSNAHRFPRDDEEVGWINDRLEGA